MAYKKIGYGESFYIVVKVDHKLVAELSTALSDADFGHKTKPSAGNDDTVFIIEAWLPNATEIYKIIKSIIQ